MKIVKLEAENFKKLRAVEIAPSGAVVEIRGANEAGKTSVLDSIAAALGGEKLCPAQPIRRGADRARVAVELDDGLVVERRWGAQKLLDGLVGRLSFDPLAFLRIGAAAPSTWPSSITTPTPPVANAGDIYIDARDRDWIAIVRDVARAIGFAWRIDDKLGAVVVSPLVPRDQLAAMAMPAIIEGSDPVDDEDLPRLAKVVAGQAYDFADAMLAERERRSPTASAEAP